MKYQLGIKRIPQESRTPIMEGVRPLDIEVCYNGLKLPRNSYVFIAERSNGTLHFINYISVEKRGEKDGIGFFIGKPIKLDEMVKPLHYRERKFILRSLYEMNLNVFTSDKFVKLYVCTLKMFGNNILFVENGRTCNVTMPVFGFRKMTIDGAIFYRENIIYSLEYLIRIGELNSGVNHISLNLINGKNGTVGETLCGLNLGNHVKFESFLLNYGLLDHNIGCPNCRSNYELIREINSSADRIEKVKYN